MKKLGWLLLLVVLSKVGYDQFMRSVAQRNARKFDVEMEQLASEMNAKMPMKGEFVTLTKVEYSERVLRFSAAVPADALSDQSKAEFAKAMRANYCVDKVIKTKVGVDYEVLGPPRSINDLTRENWTLSLRPDQC